MDTSITRMLVKRPDGRIETVERPGAFGASAAFRAYATKATRAAGRGEIIHIEVVDDPTAWD